jgi:cold shock protein
LATGRVLQFDKERGYGFIAADDGGEDVFLHTSVYDGDSYDLCPGMRIEFKIMAGDRGRKAFAARSLPDESDPVDNSAAPPSPASQAFGGPSTPPSPASQAVPVDPSAQAPQTLVPQTAPEPGRLPDDEPMCDVLSQEEFSQDLTELLLANAPTLTGQQIRQVRESMLECARKHAWIDS